MRYLERGEGNIAETPTVYLGEDSWVGAAGLSNSQGPGLPWQVGCSLGGERVKKEREQLAGGGWFGLTIITELLDQPRERGWEEGCPVKEVGFTEDQVPTGG